MVQLQAVKASHEAHPTGRLQSRPLRPAQPCSRPPCSWTAGRPTRRQQAAVQARRGAGSGAGAGPEARRWRGGTASAAPPALLPGRPRWGWLAASFPVARCPPSPLHPDLAQSVLAGCVLKMRIVHIALRRARCEGKAARSGPGTRHRTEERRCTWRRRGGGGRGRGGAQESCGRGRVAVPCAAGRGLGRRLRRHHPVTPRPQMPCRGHRNGWGHRESFEFTGSESTTMLSLFQAPARLNEVAEEARVQQH